MIDAKCDVVVYNFIDRSVCCDMPAVTRDDQGHAYCAGHEYLVGWNDVDKRAPNLVEEK